MSSSQPTVDDTKSPSCFVCHKKKAILLDCVCGLHFCIKHRFHTCEKKTVEDKERLKTQLYSSSTPSQKVEKL